MTSRSADDLSENCAIEPITILRCFRLPSDPASRHRNSQTSGPCERVDRVILPFCIASRLLLLAWSTRVSWLDCHCAKGNRAGGQQHAKRASPHATAVSGHLYKPATQPLSGDFRAGTNRYSSAVQVRTSAADPTGYRFAAAMSHCLPLTRKISDGANSARNSELHRANKAERNGYFCFDLSIFCLNVAAT